MSSVRPVDGRSDGHGGLPRGHFVKRCYPKQLNCKPDALPDRVPRQTFDIAICNIKKLTSFAMFHGHLPLFCSILLSYWGRTA